MSHGVAQEPSSKNNDSYIQRLILKSAGIKLKVYRSKELALGRDRELDGSGGDT
jgi:hypothetical protein